MTSKECLHNSSARERGLKNMGKIGGYQTTTKHNNWKRKPREYFLECTAIHVTGFIANDDQLCIMIYCKHRWKSIHTQSQIPIFNLQTS